jgi:hypothetical protein
VTAAAFLIDVCGFPSAAARRLHLGKYFWRSFVPRVNVATPMKSHGSLATIVAVSLLSASPLIGADPAKKPATPGAKKAAAPAAATSPDPTAAIKDPVAVVEGMEIKKADLDRALDAALGQSGRTAADVPAEQKIGAYRMVLDDLIVEKLIDKRAADYKISDEEVTATFKRFTGGAPEEQVQDQIKKSGRSLEEIREDIRKSLRQQKWVEEQIGGKATVTDAELDEFYKKNPTSSRCPSRCAPATFS